MSWIGAIESAFRIIGGVSAVIVIVFFFGRFVYRLSRGELSEVKLTPLQRISVDVEKLNDTVLREIASLRNQIGTQYVDVVQRFNLDHAALKELISAQKNEYERLSEKFWTKDMGDRRFAESEHDRALIRAELEAMRARCDTVCLQRTGGKA